MFLKLETLSHNFIVMERKISVINEFDNGDYDIFVSGEKYHYEDKEGNFLRAASLGEFVFLFQSYFGAGVSTDDEDNSPLPPLIWRCYFTEKFIEINANRCLRIEDKM